MTAIPNPDSRVAIERLHSKVDPKVEEDQEDPKFLLFLIESKVSS